MINSIINKMHLSNISSQPVFIADSIRPPTKWEWLRMNVPGFRQADDLIKGLINQGTSSQRLSNIEDISKLPVGAYRTGQALGEVLGFTPPGILLNILRGANVANQDGGRKFGFALVGGVAEFVAFAKLLQIKPEEAIRIAKLTGAPTVKQAANTFLKDMNLSEREILKMHDYYHTVIGAGTTKLNEVQVSAFQRVFLAVFNGKPMNEFRVKYVERFIKQGLSQKDAQALMDVTIQQAKSAAALMRVYWVRLFILS